jgi:hypothetical protein
MVVLLSCNVYSSCQLEKRGTNPLRGLAAASHQKEPPDGIST